MGHEIEHAYLMSIRMLEDGINKVPDAQWRDGVEEHLVPVRIAYHILMGLEWLISTVPPEEHLRTRRFQLQHARHGLAPLDTLPDRQTLLDHLVWMTDRVREWCADWDQQAAGQDSAFRLRKALYFLRHTQHHLGEFSAAVRLLGLERPAWEHLGAKAAALIREAEGG